MSLNRLNVKCAICGITVIVAVMTTHLAAHHGYAVIDAFPPVAQSEEIIQWGRSQIKPQDDIQTDPIRSYDSPKVNDTFTSADMPKVDGSPSRYRVTKNASKSAFYDWEVNNNELT